MMNATEAKQNVVTYIETEANKVIVQLDESIRRLSKEGRNTLNHYLSNSVRDDVRDRILSIIKEAGFSVVYASGTRGIHIKW